MGRRCCVVAVGVGLLLPSPAAADPAKAEREAARIEQARLPYVWGGGHGLRPPAPNKVPGYDCSGAVSRVLFAAGLLKRPKTSYGFMRWGRRGRGPLIIYVRPGHVFAKIRGRYFGTSARNPGGGPGWFRPPPGYVRGFTARIPRAD